MHLSFNALLKIITVSLILGSVCFSQNEPNVSFEFRWTSGKLIELVAKSDQPLDIWVNVSDFPIYSADSIVSYKAEELNITTSTNYLPGDTAKLIIFNEDNKHVKNHIVRDSIIFPPDLPGRIIKGKLPEPFPLFEHFTIVAMKNNKLQKMKVWYCEKNSGKRIIEGSDTVTQLRVYRVPYQEKIKTFIDSEEWPIVLKDSIPIQEKEPPSKIPIDLLFDSVKVTIINKGADPIQIDDNKGTPSKYTDSVTIWSLFYDPNKVYTIKFVRLVEKNTETGWIPIKSNSSGVINCIDLRNFHLLRNGGRVKIQYRLNGRSEIYEKTEIVLEKNFLEVEAGTVSNVIMDRNPTWKLELSMQGISVWGPWLLGIWDGLVVARYTSMKIPVYNKTWKTDSAKIGNIVEGKIQIALSPFQEEWEPSTFSIISNLFAKSNSLNDTTFTKFFIGFGLGIRLSVPSFNEKRTPENFGRASGVLASYIAYDPFWGDNKLALRFVNEFRIDVLKLVSNSVTISLNGKFDMPIKERGPSDIRFSIMGSVSTSTLSGLKGN